MRSFFVPSNGHSILYCCWRRILFSWLLLSTAVVWETSSVDSTAHVDKGVPPNEEDHRRYKGDYDEFQEGEVVGREEDDESLPMDDHLLAGLHTEKDPYPSSYSCTCDDSSLSSSLPPQCRNVHPQGNNYSVDDCGARIFYLVAIHNNRTLHDALYLFRGIRDARNTILFHFDTKFGLDAYQDSALKLEIEACPCGSRVEVASVHNCTWGSWSMNLPTLWSMEKAVREYWDQWDVYINLSGDTLPVYTPDTTAGLFAGPLRGINFVTSSACESGLVPTPITAFPKKWHKRAHYSYHPANLEYVDDDGIVHHNVTIKTYFGSQWMSLLPQWCSFLIRQLDRPDSLPSRYRDYLRKTRKLMTDETYIPTMLMHHYPETIPTIKSDFFLDREGVQMYAIRYERMDEHVPSSTGYYPKDQRYEVPKSAGIESPRIWGPYFLGTYDLYDIKASGALYIRKVSTVIDPNMYRILPVDSNDDIPSIAWPKEVQLSPKPDWQKTVEKYREEHAAKEQKKKEAKEAAAAALGNDGDKDNKDITKTKQEETNDHHDDEEIPPGEGRFSAEVEDGEGKERNEMGDQATKEESL